MHEESMSGTTDRFAKLHRFLPVMVLIILLLVVYTILMQIQQQSQWQSWSAEMTKEVKQIEDDTNEVTLSKEVIGKLQQQITDQSALIKAQFRQLNDQQQTDASAWKTEFSRLADQTRGHFQELQQLMDEQTAALANGGAPSQASAFKGTDAYRIYAVQPYGIVLVSQSGQYVIARIGYNLPGLGNISSIQQDQVVAGDYTIRR